MMHRFYPVLRTRRTGGSFFFLELQLNASYGAKKTPRGTNAFGVLT